VDYRLFLIGGQYYNSFVVVWFFAVSSWWLIALLVLVVAMLYWGAVVDCNCLLGGLVIVWLWFVVLRARDDYHRPLQGICLPPSNRSGSFFPVPPRQGDVCPALPGQISPGSRWPRRHLGAVSGSGFRQDYS
jgi:hypothetical protein